MPQFITDDNRTMTIAPEGGEDLTLQQVRDLAAYHAFESRQRVASWNGLDPANVYQFPVTIPPVMEADFMAELDTQLRGLAATFDAGVVTVSRKPPVTTTVELPAEIYEVLRRDGEKAGLTPQERLSQIIWRAQTYRFVSSWRDRSAELDRMADEQQAARR